MRISVAEAARVLEERGVLKRLRNDQSERVIPFVREVLGRDLPADLEDFYRAHIATIDGNPALVPVWSEWGGWRDWGETIKRLLDANAVPLVLEGCGNLFGLDLSPGESNPAVYLFDHETHFDRPEYAAGSSLGAFLLLLADEDRAYDEGWPEGWQLTIDPDLNLCPRARAVWTYT